MTLQQFIGQYSGRAVDLLAGSKSWLMDSAVLRSGNYLKVFKPVILLIPVFMMNNLLALKSPSQMCSHYKSMFQDSFIRTLERHVSFVVSAASFPARMMARATMNIFLVAGARAKHLGASFVASVVLKGFRALVTTKMSLSRLIVAVSSAKPSPLRRWGAKRILASFTGVYHNNIIAQSAWRSL